MRFGFLKIEIKEEFLIILLLACCECVKKMVMLKEMSSD